MNEDRYTLTPAAEPGYWTVADNENGIEITFKEKAYNTTQTINYTDAAQSKTMAFAMKLPTYMREMADWISQHHYNIAMPSLTEKRLSMGQRIKGLRTEQGLTLQQLADYAGITRANLSNIEGGRYSVGLDVLNRIAIALGVELKME